LQTLKQFPTFIPGQGAPIEEPWINPNGPDGFDGGNGSPGGNMSDGGILTCENGCYMAPTKFGPTTKQLLFTVSPTYLRLYWKVFTADEYTGSGWRRSTQEDVVTWFPNPNSGAGTIFTVELNTSAKRLSLPIPPPPSSPDLSVPRLTPSQDFTLSVDELADIYGIEMPEPINRTSITYGATWHYTEIDKTKITLAGLPEEIQTLYLQLPAGLPRQVYAVANNLKDSSLNTFDQILADMFYLVTNFEYDTAFKDGHRSRIIENDWVLSYLKWGKGICVDAATALAIILRCQGIPARINFGFKPGSISADKILYFSTEAHAETEAYLPPYGWVRFDATPPPKSVDYDDDGVLVEHYPALKPRRWTIQMNPKYAEGQPGDHVIFFVAVDNAEFYKDSFELEVSTDLGWDVKFHPENLTLRPFEQSEFTIFVTIPQDAAPNQRCQLYATVSGSNGKQASDSGWITVARGPRMPTATLITDVPENLIIRLDSFYVEGTVTDAFNRPVSEMPVIIRIKETKESEGFLCGQGFSQENGQFRIECHASSNVAVGDYHVVAYSLGTEIYTPSESDPPIKIGAKTSIQLNMPEIILLNDKVAITGSLIDDSETVIPNVPVSLRIDENELGEQRTDKNGRFRAPHQFFANGSFEVNALFSGTEYYLPSSTSLIVNVYKPVIETSLNYFVRGEENAIQGLVKAGTAPVHGQNVTVALDGHNLATLETGPDGSFTHTHFVDSEQSLDGSHMISFLIQQTETRLDKSIPIKARTWLNISAPQDVMQGESFSFDAYLFDDQGSPIRDKKIIMEDLSKLTTEDGEAEFSKQADLWFWFRDMTFACHFEGSEKYLSSQAYIIVATRPNPFIFIFPGALVLCAFTTYFVHRWRQPKTRKPMRARATKPEAKTTNLGRPKPFSESSNAQAGNLEIAFPDIRHPFPNVWGLGDALSISCRLDSQAHARRLEGREICLSLEDDEIAHKALPKQGNVLFVHSFGEKGDFTLTALLKDKAGHRRCQGQEDLRIVDYREEVIRLYSQFLHTIKDDVDPKKDATAREIENELTSVKDYNRTNLRNIIDCFEKAEYSDHSLGREDYETMYLSLRELKPTA